MEAYLQNLILFISNITRVYTINLTIVDENIQFFDLAITRNQEFILHREQ